MTIIGFAFNKMIAEQKKPSKGNLKINNNIRLEGLEKTNLALDDKRVALKINFAYAVNYKPEVGSIQLLGDVLFLQDKEGSEALLAEWDKKKQLPKKLSTHLVNHILQKCTIQSLILSKDINLPPPIPMPGVKKRTNAKNNTASEPKSEAVPKAKGKK